MGCVRRTRLRIVLSTAGATFCLATLAAAWPCRLEAVREPCAGCALGRGLLRLARQDFTQSSQDLSRTLIEAERARAADERRLSETRRRAQSVAEAILRTALRPRAPSPTAQPPLLQSA